MTTWIVSPLEKVKELWSSIHTFFADSGFENVWAVIPFDETHLACAFGDETDEQTKQLTKYLSIKLSLLFIVLLLLLLPTIEVYSTNCLLKHLEKQKMKRKKL